jgi:hypothetical protein
MAQGLLKLKLRHHQRFSGFLCLKFAEPENFAKVKRPFFFSRLLSLDGVATDLNATGVEREERLFSF